MNIIKTRCEQVLKDNNHDLTQRVVNEICDSFTNHAVMDLLLNNIDGGDDEIHQRITDWHNSIIGDDQHQANMDTR